MATRAGVVLTRILTGPDAEGDFRQFAERVEKRFTGPVTVAKDLMQF